MYGLQPADAESIQHGPLVAAIAMFLRPILYVELGAAQGETFRIVAPHAARAVAVDLSASNERHFAGLGEFWCGDTRDFLKAQPDDSIDLAFLDSSHEFMQTCDECELLNVKVRRNGIILLHDAYPPNEEQLSSDRCGDVHLAIDFLKTNLGWEVTTLPAQYGLAICRKNMGRQLLWK